MLFHDTGIALDPEVPSGAGTYSCASCHFAGAGFQAGRHQGIGEGGLGFGLNGEGRDADPSYEAAFLDVQPTRTPSAMNNAYQEVMLWNGQFGATGPNVGTEYSWQIGTPKQENILGFQGLETQAIAGLDVHRLLIDRDFLDQTGYTQLFDAAFPDIEAEDRYSRITAGLAIAAYERTLLANRAPFQHWLQGQKQAMSELEKEGALLFFDKAGCADCHTGPALSSMAFYALGMDDLRNCPEPTFRAPAFSRENLGRGGFTDQPDDMYKFKVPQLYNLADSPFYGHGASFRSIAEVIQYKNQAVPQNQSVPAAQLAVAFRPLNLTDSEVEAIALFLAKSLRDPELERYVPESLLSGLCFPNNDPISQVDLNCN